VFFVCSENDGGRGASYTPNLEDLVDKQVSEGRYRISSYQCHYANWVHSCSSINKQELIEPSALATDHGLSLRSDIQNESVVYRRIPRFERAPTEKAYP